MEKECCYYQQLTKEFDRQYDQYKEQYESYVKYHGFSMVLRGDEITIVRTSTLQVESGI